MQKFYAVAIGRKVGIFTDVDYAQYQVFKFKGGQSKSFTHLDLAKDYILSYNKNIEPNNIIAYHVWDFYAVSNGNESGIFIKPKELNKYIENKKNVKIKSFENLASAKKFILTHDKNVEKDDIKIYDETKKGDKISRLEYYHVFIKKETGQPFKFYNTLKKIKINNKKYLVENFKKKEDAFKFLEQFNNGNDIVEFAKNLEYGEIKKHKYKDIILDENTIYAFTDGSFNNDKKIIGYSVVFVKNKEIILQLSEGDYYSYNDNRGSNVAEFKASLMAIETAIEYNFNNISICHDFNGVKDHANGHSKKKNIYAQEYGAFISKYSELLDFNFRQVKGHSGNEWNELADYLAKKEAEIVA